MAGIVLFTEISCGKVLSEKNVQLTNNSSILPMKE